MTVHAKSFTSRAPSHRHGSTVRHSGAQRWVIALLVGSTTMTTTAAFGATRQNSRSHLSAHSKGQVSVFYAGSLVATMTKLAPAFDKATGYTFVGLPGGSSALAAQIKGKTQRADVFLSAGTATNQTLMGTKNGNWESWYVKFGTTPLLLGYSPKSSFAHDLKTQPWYKVVTKPGFLLGRTDPATDPKGVLAVRALDEAATTYHNPKLKAVTTSTTGVFPEETLVGRLQAGQLDAGFFYGVEAKAAHLKTVTLGSVHLMSPYTITVVNGSPNRQGAIAFIAFLLGNKGTAILRNEGLSLMKPGKLTGSRAAVPAALKRYVS